MTSYQFELRGNHTMSLFEIYRNASTKSIALQYGELQFTYNKYPGLEDIENPYEILANMAIELEPYIFAENELPQGTLVELIDAFSDFQEAFDVDLEEEIDGLKTFLK